MDSPLSTHSSPLSSPRPVSPAAPGRQSPGANSPPPVSLVRPDGLAPRGAASSSAPAPRRLPGDTPLLDALHRLDLPTAQALYDREAAGRTPVQVWRSAAEGRRHDLLLAVLVLHRHQGIERHLWNTPRDGSLNGELQRVLTGGLAPSLVAQVKQLPYYSEKPARITDQNLNCQLQFIDSPQAEEIACRHLAVTWLAQVDAAGKPDYEILGDAVLLPQHVSYASQGLYRRLVEGAPVQLVPLAQWGGFIATQLAAIESSGGPPSRRFLVSSNIHAMAWELKVKPGPGDARYVANFYDPNLTAAHKRVASTSLQRFQALQAGDLVRDAEAMAAYFEGEEEATVITVPPDGVQSLPPALPGGDPERRISGPVPPPTASVVHRLMSVGAAGSLRDLLPSFAELAVSDAERAVAVLEGRGANGVPALHLAMQYGLVHAVQAYGALAATLDLEPDDHERLLAACRPDGTPALFMAMQEGHASAVETFIDLVAASHLPLQTQIDLLVAPAPDEFQCLTMAMQEDQLAAATAYLDAVASHPGLGVEDQLSLLAAPGPNDWPALAMGLVHGQPATLEAVVRWIAGREDFSAADRCELLLARTPDGTPGLVHAMADDETAAKVRVFVRTVLDSPMDDLDKVDILLAGAAPGHLLRHAREQGASQCLAAYRAAVLASRPSLAVELMLLSEVPRRPRS